MCRGITVQGAASLLGGLALLLTPLPLLLYIHGAKLREHVKQRKEAAAAAQAATRAVSSGTVSPKGSEKALAIAERIPPGGTVEKQSSLMSGEGSSDPPDSLA